MNKYLDIKDNHPIARESDKILLNYDTTHFEVGPSPNYNLKIKYPILSIDTTSLEKDTNNKLDVKLKVNAGISKDTNGIYQTYQINSVDLTSLEKDTNNKLDVKLKPN